MSLRRSRTGNADRKHIQTIVKIVLFSTFIALVLLVKVRDHQIQFLEGPLPIVDLRLIDTEFVGIIFTLDLPNLEG